MYSSVNSTRYRLCLLRFQLQRRRRWVHSCMLGTNGQQILGEDAIAVADDALPRAALDVIGGVAALQTEPGTSPGSWAMPMAMATQ